MTKYLGVVAAIVPLALAAAERPPSVYNALSFGVKNDRRTNNARAIQKAIDACSRAGGGTVYFPAGDFLTGTIVLRTNVTIHLSPGATLWGSREMADYSPPYLI